MRTRILITSVLFALSVILVPSFASAASVFDSNFHIVPDAHTLDASCAEGAPLSFGAVMSMVQSMVNVSISLGALIFMMIMAWAGVLFIMSAANPESRNAAKKMLMNGAIGLLIVMSAWLIVDFVMKTLYNPNSSGFGPWNSILGDGPTCVVATEVTPLFTGSITAGQLNAINDYSGTAGESSTSGSGSNCPAANPSGMVAFSASVCQGGEVEKATPTTVQNFLAMREAAARDGVNLLVSDGYRAESEQVYLWNKYCPSGVCGSTKVGKPCSLGGNGSNHNSGVALDIAVGCKNGNGSCNTKAYNWLKANGARWNFRNAIPTDPPHWSPSGH